MILYLSNLGNMGESTDGFVRRRMFVCPFSQSERGLYIYILVNFVQDWVWLRLEVLNDIIFGESWNPIEKGPTPGGAGLRERLGTQAWVIGL
jgi:hypothetical protein